MLVQHDAVGQRVTPVVSHIAFSRKITEQESGSDSDVNPMREWKPAASHQCARSLHRCPASTRRPPKTHRLGNPSHTVML